MYSLNPKFDVLNSVEISAGVDPYSFGRDFGVTHRRPGPGRADTGIVIAQGAERAGWAEPAVLGDLGVDGIDLG